MIQIYLLALRQLIIAADASGVPAQLSISGNEKLHKSVVGGIVSLALYILSGLYFGLVMYHWLEGGLLPRVQLQTKLITYDEYKLTGDVLVFTVNPNQVENIDPFQEDGNIITPLLYIVTDYNFSKPIPLFKTKKSEEFLWFSAAQIPDINLIQNSLFDQNRSSQVQLLLQFVRCQQPLLGKGKACASDEVIEKYLNAPQNLMAIKLGLQAYDEEVQRLVEIPKSYYFMMDHRTPSVNQIILKTSILQVDTGLLFTSKTTNKYISSAEIVSQVVSPQYILSSYGVQSIFTCLIRLDTFQENEIITYPKIGEICADISSVIGIILSLKIIMQYYNKCGLQEQLTQSIIDSYYSGKQKVKSFKLKFSRNQYEEVRKIALAKVNVFNLFHEIARIQSILLKLDPEGCREKRSQTHHEPAQGISYDPDNDPDPDPQLLPQVVVSQQGISSIRDGTEGPKDKDKQIISESQVGDQKFIGDFGTFLLPKQ